MLSKVLGGNDDNNNNNDNNDEDDEDDDVDRVFVIAIFFSLLGWIAFCIVWVVCLCRNRMIDMHQNKKNR